MGKAPLEASSIHRRSWFLSWAVPAWLFWATWHDLHDPHGVGRKRGSVVRAFLLPHHHLAMPRNVAWERRSRFLLGTLLTGNHDPRPGQKLKLMRPVLGSFGGNRRFLGLDAVKKEENGATVEPEYFSSSLRSVAIVGGGLAGLSTAYHLQQQQQHHHRLVNPTLNSHPHDLLQMNLPAASTGPERSTPGLQITILDHHPVGRGGASAVAGGLVHPLTPKGKLAYLGRESLQATWQLIEAAVQATAEQAAGSSIVLRQEMYRVVLSSDGPDQVELLRQTARELPDWAQWMDRDQLLQEEYWSSSDDVLLLSEDVVGALRLNQNACRVIHCPSYLQGLWAACQQQAERCGGEARWSLVDPRNAVNWPAQLQDFDAVVLAAGHGLFDPQGPILSTAQPFPVQLVRGQSIEMDLPAWMNGDPPALLCGKYVAPLLDPSRVLIGATHEFDDTPMSPESVTSYLQEKTRGMLPARLWKEGSIRAVTAGFRVQSARGNHGRLPMIGRLSDSSLHPNAWLFTGLSSRGLLYHGLFGRLLAEAMVSNSEDVIRHFDADLLWWQKRMSNPTGGRL